MRTILLVEDDVSLGSTLKERLVKEGFNVMWVRTQKEAEALYHTTDLCLAIIDVGLPDGDGFDLAKQIKSQTKVPFIFVTAMNSAEYRLAGYEIGADEYIPKPFHLRELLLRIRKVLAAATDSPVLSIHGVNIDLHAMTITHADGTKERPTPRDFQILKHLIQHSPKVISREELLSEACKVPESVAPTHRTIDNSIVRLRQIFGEEGRNLIRSVRGIGYQWVI